MILAEGFTVATIAVGLAMSAGVLYVSNKLIPLPGTAKNIKFFWVAIYPFFLIGQIYLSAFNAIKLIFTGAEVDIIKVKTKISSNFLRTMLANSITLTPGTISLELQDDEITVLLLKRRNDKNQVEGDSTKGKMESLLLKAER